MTFILGIQGCLSNGKIPINIIHYVTKLKEINYYSLIHTNIWVPTFFLGIGETTVTKIKIKNPSPSGVMF